LSPHFLYNTVESVFVDGTDRFRRKLQRDPPVFLSEEKTLGLQVGQKTALGFDIGMRNLVSRNRAFSCNLTYSCHNLKFWEGEISELFGLGQIFLKPMLWVLSFEFWVLGYFEVFGLIIDNYKKSTI